MMNLSVSKRLYRTGILACSLSLAGPVVRADEVSACAGLLRAAEAKPDEAKVLPLAATFSATTRKDWGHFLVTNVLTNETFKMPVYPHYPVAAGVEPLPLGEIENDGKNYIVPVDLTGRGVSDLLVGREAWGGWRVYSNGQALAKPFDGFVAGFVPKGGDAVKSATLVMDLGDLQVDNNLLGAVGDFLGNGTEQLAYFRPGWGGIQVVGAHGKVLFEADLSGIAADKEGARQHYLFAFKAQKPGEKTRLAYHRSGIATLKVFTVEGQRFVRSEADAKTTWNQLNQNNPNPL